MPFLQLQTIKGLLSSEQKRYLIEKFTDLLVEVEGGGNPDFKKMVWIKIEEQEPEHWAIGELRPTPEFISLFVNACEANRKRLASK